jgi:hypothetical protein
MVHILFFYILALGPNCNWNVVGVLELSIIIGIVDSIVLDDSTDRWICDSEITGARKGNHLPIIFGLLKKISSGYIEGLYFVG